VDAASRVYQGCGPLAPADQPPILAPSCLRLAFSVRISGKFAANHATFPPHDNPAISTAYNLRTKSSKSTGSERIGPRRVNLGLFPPWPVNRSAPKTPGILPKGGQFGRAERADHFETGGWGRIRTLGTPRTTRSSRPSYRLGPRERLQRAYTSKRPGKALRAASLTQKSDPKDNFLILYNRLVSPRPL
jgi:hypothetical protein